MLTSFFGKSNPINFLLLGIYMVVVSILRLFFKDSTPIDLPKIGWILIALGCLIFSMLLLDFIVRKNKLSGSSTFAIYIFSTSAMMLPQIVHFPKIIFANLCILFALRRILSLQSFKNDEKKILDSSLWIVLASCFYFWSLLLFIGLYLALILKPQLKFRYLLIPPIATLGCFVTATAYFLMFEGNMNWIKNWIAAVDFNFTSYGNVEVILWLSIVTATILWAFVSRLLRKATVQKKDRPNFLLINQLLLLFMVIVLFSSEKSTSEILLLFPIAAIVIASFLEVDSDRWFKEALLWTFGILPLLLIFI